jgi:multidrug efflux pump subunit AcrA (membrane-fusion protein)
LQFGDNRVDPSTGTVQIYGIVPNKEKMFVPGSRVRVRLAIGKPYKASLVPDTAILADQNKRYVLIVDGEKRARRRDVTLGTLTDDGMRAITPDEKLAEGETVPRWLVVVDNLQRVRLNDLVDAELPAAAKPTTTAAK